MTDATARGAASVWGAELAEASEYLAVLDAQLRILFLNRVPAGVGAVVGQRVTELVPDEYGPPMERAAAAALETGRAQYLRTSGPGPDGEESFYSVWLLPTDSGIEAGRLTLIATDLTHRGRTEEALVEERSVLRSLVDNAPDYILVLDRAHRVVFINRVDRGFTENILLGACADDFVPEAHRARARAAVDSVFESGQGASLELEIETPVGTFWYNTRIGPVFRDGRVERVSLVATDVTEAKRLEHTSIEERESLMQSEARFRTMVDSAPEALVIFDVEAQRFIDANPKACELFELSREELLTRGPIELSAATAPDGRPSDVAAREEIAAAVAGEHRAFQWTHVTSTGREVPCEVGLIRLPHLDKVLLRGSLIDISERLRSEAERARLNDELFQARKMQAIGQLTGGVAHDFNNLLTVIMSHAELMRSRASTVAQAGAHAEQVLQAARRAANLTQQLLAFSRRQPLRPRRVDLRELITGLEEMLRRTLGETIQVRTVLPDGLWACEIDPTQMENAVLNLAINSRDAMPQGGELEIEACNVDAAPASPSQGDRDQRPHVLLTVRDTGLGMAPDVRAHAFEPFFTTKDVGKGSGLGLSMVYGFVSQSGGQVRITSTPGSGTEVAMYLPRGEGDGSATRALRDPVDGPAPGRGEVLLVVEDDAQVRAATVGALRELGYSTLEASGASEALQVLGAAPEIALLLSDVILPGGTNGPELAKIARERRPGLPVVFMSGYPRDALVEDARLGADVILLRKPFTHAELTAAILERLGARPAGWA